VRFSLGGAWHDEAEDRGHGPHTYIGSMGPGGKDHPSRLRKAKNRNPAVPARRGRQAPPPMGSDFAVIRLRHCSKFARPRGRTTPFNDQLPRGRTTIFPNVLFITTAKTTRLKHPAAADGQPMEDHSAPTFGLVTPRTKEGREFARKQPHFRPPYQNARPSNPRKMGRSTTRRLMLLIAANTPGGGGAGVRNLERELLGP